MVTVRVSDGHNEDLAFNIYISPGSAPVECIADLFVAMSGLHRAFGGEGLTFSLEETVDSDPMTDQFLQLRKKLR